MSEDWTEAGPPAPAIRKAVILRRYSCGGDPGPDEGDAPPAAPGPDDADRARDRARDLAELSDYVRTLADRMGLKDWTFEVDPDLDEYEDGLVGLVVLDDFPRHGLFHVAGAYFSASPEARRFAVAREYVFHHLYITDELEDSGEPGEGVKAIAAAWAPCLPLPLVGWMRRAGDTEKAEHE